MILLFIVIFILFGEPSEGELTGDMEENEFDKFIEERKYAEESLETYKMDMNMNILTEREEIGMNIESKININSKEAHVKYDMSEIDNVRPSHSTFEAYYDEEYVYKDTDGEDWEKLSVEDIEDETIEDIWNMEENVNTDQYYYGDVNINKKDDIIIVETELTGSEMEAVKDEFNGIDIDSIFGPSFDQVTIVEEVDKETLNTLNHTIEGSVSDRNESVDFKMNINFYDHNEDFDSSIPDEIIENSTKSNGLNHPLT